MPAPKTVMIIIDIILLIIVLIVIVATPIYNVYTIQMYIYIYI